MSGQPPEILYFFFCENVRNEADGKVSAFGMWGDRCRFFGPAPGYLPMLALHAYIRNPDQVPYPVELRVQVPGGEPMVHRFALSSEPGKSGTNVNVNIAGVMLPEEGTIVADLVIQSDPPCSRQVRLDVVFEPPAVVTAAG